jgi:hypothetical protein
MPHDASPATNQGAISVVRRPGQLSPGWTSVVAVAWAGVCLGLGVVAIASRRLGLSVWWMGPKTDAVPFVITVLPFVLPATAALWALSGRTRAPLVGVVAALATGAVALGDISRVPGLAAVQGMFALGGLLVSIAAVGGVLQPASAN